MLEKFRQAQQAAVCRLTELEHKGLLPSPLAGTRPSFSGALRKNGPLAVIAEYKRASPSLGSINLHSGPEEVAKAYADAGAACLSVLTEETHFKGDIAFIERMAGPGLPLLRKDFLIHPLQVRESASTPAAAVLLIARMLDDATFTAMLDEVRTAGLEAVLEIFDETDLERTRAALQVSPLPQVMIQVNNRDLQTLTVSVEPSRRLIAAKRDGELWISASGVASALDLRKRRDLGFDAALIGGSLMEGSTPGHSLALLMAGIHEGGDD